ncbi:MAG: heme-copper oxidase subunit III [Acidobacteriaceae bacterium]|nr:heme-copper oxidase subunit III [Acidobacteriaceae bacterium]
MSVALQCPRSSPSISELPLEERRGSYAMWCVIATESALFASFFAAYFYLGNNKARWQVDHPPKLLIALVLLAILVSSSFVLEWGKRRVVERRYAAARFLLAVTIFMGLVFLVLQAYEYIDHWKTLTPFSDSYGSIFYAITSFHAAHVIVGLLMLAYVLVLPRYAPARETPFRPYETVALYWHFVDVVWILVVLVLYVIPNMIAHG